MQSVWRALTLGVLGAGIISGATLTHAQSASTQRLEDAEVEKAIKAGQDRKFGHLISDCNATAGFGSYMKKELRGGSEPTVFKVTVSTNVGQIAFSAEEAKRQDKPFTSSDVPEQLRAPAAYVVVVPVPLLHGSRIRVGGVRLFTSRIDKVGIESKTNPEVVIEPDTFEKGSFDWPSKIQTNRVVASFPIDAVKSLPPGDFDVVVATQEGERRCKVGTRDRARLFP